MSNDAFTWDSAIGPAIPPPPPPPPPQPPPPAPVKVVTAAAPDLSADSERGLLGSILLDAEKTWSAIDAHGISGPDFHDHKHQSIFKAVASLRKRGRPVDLLTVTDYLKTKNELDRIGGPTALHRMVDDCPTSAHASYYAGLVSAHAQRRRLASLANHWAESASRGMPGPELLDLIKKGIESDISKRDPQSNSPEIRHIGAFELPPKHDPDELLKHRFLCRGGAMLLVGPTGIGKSSFVMQGAIRWSMGQEFFGIQAAAPMKILMVQAENDDGDIAEMRDGVYRGLKASGQLKDEDQDVIAGQIAVVCEDSRTGREFGASLDRLLGYWKPDLVIIDPALAYLGGDALKQADVTLFCRNILNPLIHRHRCGLILVHHTNKPPKGEEKGEWKAGDLAYLGQGAADWANWARAVVAIRAKGSHSVYELCLGKRGRRTGWKDKDGKPLFVKDIAHARETGMICWRSPDDAEALDAATPKGAAEKRDWQAVKEEAVKIAMETVRTRDTLKEEVIRRTPGGIPATTYDKIIPGALRAAKDNGKLEMAVTHDGVATVHLVGPADGTVMKKKDQMEKTREEKKQRELSA